MKSRFVAAFVGFAVLVMPVIASAASNSSTGDTRYFLQTTKSFWHTALGARNIFPDGFTADLSDLQLRFAKLAGLHPIPVKSFNILDDTALDATASASPTPKPAPTKPFAWGVQYVLGSGDVSRTIGGKGITVAILDTGVDTSHPDLTDRIAGCTDFTDASQALIDGQCADGNGHGTHMAGIVAADGGTSGKGIWGVAPQVDLLIYRVCNDDGQCLSDDIAKAMTAAVDDGANIIVLGLGGESDSSFIDTAIQYAADHDVLVVAAAGNDGPYDNSIDWPAQNPGVVAVGALSSNGVVADFSSRGTSLELVAPGENIESTFKDGTYAILSGTSMAAPHIAGLAARIWQSKADHPAQETRAILHRMAHDLGPTGKDSVSGWGAPTL